MAVTVRTLGVKRGFNSSLRVQDLIDVHFYRYECLTATGLGDGSLWCYICYWFVPIRRPKIVPTGGYLSRQGIESAVVQIYTNCHRTQALSYSCRVYIQGYHSSQSLCHSTSRYRINPNFMAPYDSTNLTSRGSEDGFLVAGHSKPGHLSQPSRDIITWDGRL